VFPYCSFHYGSFWLFLSIPSVSSLLIDWENMYAPGTPRGQPASPVFDPSAHAINLLAETLRSIDFGHGKSRLDMFNGENDAKNEFGVPGGSGLSVDHVKIASRHLRGAAWYWYDSEVLRTNTEPAFAS
jgi:hypothetical protein